MWLEAPKPNCGIEEEGKAWASTPGVSCGAQKIGFSVTLALKS